MARIPTTKSTRYDLTRPFVLAALGLPLDGLELEFSQQMARNANRPHDASRPGIPWSGLIENRTTLLAGANANGSNYLVGTDNLSPLDVLRPFSIAAQAGVTELPGLTANTTIPRTTAITSGSWQSNETNQQALSTPALGQIALTPKIFIGVLEISRQLLLQAPTAGAYIRRELSRTAAAAVDSAILAGTGQLGQPTGIVSQAPTTLSGTSFSWATAAQMKSILAAGNTVDQRIGFISTPAVRQLLEVRQRFTGSNSAVWEDDQLVYRPAAVTTVMPTGTLIGANWAEVAFATWGDSFELEINPYDTAGFQVGKIQARIFIACDVALLHPAAVVVASGIT